MDDLESVRESIAEAIGDVALRGEGVPYDEWERSSVPVCRRTLIETRMHLDHLISVLDALAVLGLRRALEGGGE